MDRRVLIIRRWLLIAALVLCGLICPEAWFGLGLILGPIIWTRTSGGSTGILIHPTGPPWAIAVGDSTDTTCECCGDPCCGGGNPPTQMQLDVVTTNTGCADCKPPTGAYTLDLIADSADRVCNFDPLPCYWQFVEPTGAFCGGIPPATGYALFINARSDTSPDQLDAAVYRHSDCLEFFRRRKTYTDGNIPNCESYSAEVLDTIIVNVGTCAYTLSVTSL